MSPSTTHPSSDKGAVFNTKKAAIQVKNAYPAIVVDNAVINSENGIILQAIINDDLDMPGGAPGGMAGGGMPGAGGSTKTEINATFKNATLKGDIINSMTSKGDLIVSFEKATITGAITTADQSVAGEKPSKEKYYLIGEIKHTYGPTDDEYGVKVSLDKNSKWIVDQTSYLNTLTIANGASVTAPAGYKVTLTVDGAVKPIKAGDYKGKIVLTVTKG